MIPKPVKAKKIIEDKRKEYLEEWKRLFEEIDPSIKVSTWYDDDFIKIMDDIGLRRIPFHHDNEKRILVLFKDHNVINFQYLCGTDHNEMFSNTAIEADSMYQDDGFDCFPVTQTWEEFLIEIRSTFESHRSRIPKPPEKEKSAE